MKKILLIIAILGIFYFLYTSPLNKSGNGNIEKIVINGKQSHMLCKMQGNLKECANDRGDSADFICKGDNCTKLSETYTIGKAKCTKIYSKDGTIMQDCSTYAE